MFAQNIEHDPRLRLVRPVSVAGTPTTPSGSRPPVTDAAADERRPRSGGGRLMTARPHSTPRRPVAEDRLTQQGERNRKRRRRRPYFLLLPGFLCLSLFFVVPIADAGLPARCYTGDIWTRATRSPGTGTPTRRSAPTTTGRSSSGPSCTRAWRPSQHCHRLPAGLRHRLQGRAVDEPAAGAGHRAVLHQLPDPDAGLAEHPGRRRLGRGLPAGRMHLLGRRTGDCISTPFAVICGLTYNFLPFMTLPLYASWRRSTARLSQAAADLYASAGDGVLQGDPARCRCPAWSPARC